MLLPKVTLCQNNNKQDRQMRVGDLMHYLSSAYAFNNKIKEIKTNTFMDILSDMHFFLQNSLKIDRKLKCHSKIFLIDFIWQF